MAFHLLRFTYDISIDVTDECMLITSWNGNNKVWIRSVNKKGIDYYSWLMKKYGSHIHPRHFNINIPTVFEVVYRSDHEQYNKKELVQIQEQSLQLVRLLIEKNGTNEWNATLPHMNNLSKFEYYYSEENKRQRNDLENLRFLKKHDKYNWDSLKRKHFVKRALTSERLMGISSELQYYVCYNLYKDHILQSGESTQFRLVEGIVPNHPLKMSLQFP